MVNVSIPTKIPLSFVNFSKNLFNGGIYKLCVFDRLNVWNWLKDLRLTVRSSILICFLTMPVTHYLAFQFDGKWFPVSNKKYTFKSTPTTLLFSLLFSMVGTSPHLLSSHHLWRTELAPGNTSGRRLRSFSPGPPLRAKWSVAQFVLYEQSLKRQQNMSSRNDTGKLANILLKKGKLSFCELNAGSYLPHPLKTAKVF